MSNSLVPNTITLTAPAARMQAPDDLLAVARTMGNTSSFSIRVSNISRSGMLLEWNNEKFRPPFRENTLIELELKTNVKGQPRRINCLAKVVRRNLSQSSAQFGVRMIHNDEQDHMNWLEMITTLEKSSTPI